MSCQDVTYVDVEFIRTDKYVYEGYDLTYLKDISDDVMKTVIRSVDVEVYVVHEGKRMEVRFDMMYMFRYNECILLLSIDDLYSIKDRYEVHIRTSSSYSIKYNRVMYRIRDQTKADQLNNSLYLNDSGLVTAAGATLGRSNQGMGNSSTAQVASTSVNLLLSADPTGVLTQYSQNIKIVGKLYYLDVRYNPLVNIFLKSVDEASGTLKEDSYSIEYTRSISFKNKPSKNRLLVSGDTYLLWKILVYGFSFLIRLLSILVLKTKIRLNRAFLHIVYYSAKVHTVIVNSFLIDFTFYISRSQLHNRSFVHSMVSSAVMLMFNVDMMILVSMALDDRAWRKLYRMKVGEEIGKLALQLAHKIIKDKRVSYTKDDFKEHYTMMMKSRDVEEAVSTAKRLYDGISSASRLV